MDRFRPCSACPPHGFVCGNDTAILAPNFSWKWSNQSEKEFFKCFVNNIHSSKPDYDTSYSTFNTLLPKPLKCPYAKSCEGGIDSECHHGYKGVLCATCSKGFYFRFHTCLKCPRLTVTVTSSILVISLFVAVFLIVLWGDSKRAENNRTVADVVMSCFKIVLGFYQVIAGIFSALAKVQWPVILMCRNVFLKRKARLYLPTESRLLYPVFHSSPQLVLAHGLYTGIISRRISTFGFVSHLQIS